MKLLTQVNEITNPAIPQLQSKTGVSFFQGLLPALVTLFLVAGSLLFFFFLITGAITWITSGGDKEKLNTARTRLSNAIVGFIILLASFAIVALIEKFFRIDITLLDIEAIKIR